MYKDYPAAYQVSKGSALQVTSRSMTGSASSKTSAR